MTNDEELTWEKDVVVIDLLRKIAHAVGAYHDAKADLVANQIQARLDSATADEVDALK